MNVRPLTNTVVFSIDIDPSKIEAKSLEAFLLKSLIDSKIEKNDFEFDAITPKDFNLNYSDIPISLRNHPFFKKHQSDFIIKIKLTYDIWVNPRSTPTSDDKYRYQVVSLKPKHTTIDFFKNFTDIKTFTPNQYLLVYEGKEQNQYSKRGSKKYSWKLYYVNDKSNPIAIATHWLSENHSNKLTEDRKTAIKKEIEEHYDIPTLGKTEKTEVYKSLVELAPDEQDKRFLMTKNRQYAIRKKQFSDKCEQNLNRDREIARLAGFNNKPAFHVNNALYSVMEILPGEQLRESIVKTSDDTDTLVDLLLEMLWQVHRLHELDIIHGDIKPENLLRNKNKLKLFDFDMSKKESDPRLGGGSPLYIAPELAGGFIGRPVSSCISKKTDVFSVGISILELFHCNWIEEQESIGPHRVIKNRMSPSFSITFSSKDFEKTNLINLHKEALKKLIRDFTQFKSTNRFEIYRGIVISERIKFERKLAKLAWSSTIDEKKRSLTKAHHAAIDARTKLTKEKYKNLEQIRDSIDEALGKFAENSDEDVVNEFIETLRIEALVGCKTKTEIQTKVDEILTTFNNLRTELFDITKALDNGKNINFDTIESASLQHIAEFVERGEIALNKHLRYQVTLDDINLLNKKMEKDIKRLTSNSFMISFLKLSSLPDNTLQQILRPTFHNLILSLEKNPERKLTKEVEKFLNDFVNLMLTKPDVSVSKNIGKEEKDRPESLANKNTSLDQLKMELKIAIATYFATTVLDNLKSGGGVWSIPRQRNIEDLLEIINAAENIGPLYDDVKHSADTKIRGTIFNTAGIFSRSLLFKNIAVILKNYRNHPDILTYQDKQKNKLSR